MGRSTSVCSEIAGRLSLIIIANSMLNCRSNSSLCDSGGSGGGPRTGIGDHIPDISQRSAVVSSSRNRKKRFLCKLCSTHLIWKIYKKNRFGILKIINLGIWREEKGESDDIEGVDGVEVVTMPSSFLALSMTEWTRASGPKARRIISFSPWSWKRRRPMILAALSESRVWILEKTIIVAS